MRPRGALTAVRVGGAAILLFAPLLVGQPAGTSGFIAPSGIAPTANYSRIAGAVARDFDGDGLTDVIARSAGIPFLQFFQNTGAGGLAFPTPIATNSAGGAVFGDFDGDGSTDVLDMGPLPAPGPCVHFGIGGGAISLPTCVSTGLIGPNYRVGVFDLDGDGDDDLLFSDDPNASPTGTAVEVYEWGGAGSGFVLVTTATGPPGATFLFAAAGDFDGDAVQDVLFVDSSASTTLDLYPYQGSAVGGGYSLNPLAAILGLPIVATGVNLKVVDSDGDGLDDVFMQGGVGGQGGIIRFPGDATALLGPMSLVAPYAWGPRDYEVGDFNQDGLVDVLTLHSGSAVVGVTNVWAECRVGRTGGSLAGASQVTPLATMAVPVFLSNFPVLIPDGQSDLDSDGDLDCLLMSIGNTGAGGPSGLGDLTGVIRNDSVLSAGAGATVGASVHGVTEVTPGTTVMSSLTGGVPNGIAGLGVSLATQATACCGLQPDLSALLLPVGAHGVTYLDATGAATFSAALPADPGLVGTELFAQWVSLTPGFLATAAWSPLRKLVIW